MLDFQLKFLYVTGFLVQIIKETHVELRSLSEGNQGSTNRKRAEDVKRDKILKEQWAHLKAGSRSATDAFNVFCNLVGDAVLEYEVVAEFQDKEKEDGESSCIEEDEESLIPEKDNEHLASEEDDEILDPVEEDESSVTSEVASFAKDETSHIIVEEEASKNSGKVTEKETVQFVFDHGCGTEQTDEFTEVEDRHVIVEKEAATDLDETVEKESDKFVYDEELGTQETTEISEVGEEASTLVSRTIEEAKEPLVLNKDEDESEQLPLDSSAIESTSTSTLQEIQLRESHVKYSEDESITGEGRFFYLTST